MPIRMLVCDWYFWCPIRGQHLLCCFCDLVVRRSLPASSTVCRVPVWLVPESFLKEELLVKVGPPKTHKKKTQVSMLAKQSKTKMHQLKRSHYGPMEGKFVNISESTSTCRLAHANLKVYSASFILSYCVTEKKNLTTNYLQLKRANILLLHIA